jgi:predicted deacylase
MEAHLRGLNGVLALLGMAGDPAAAAGSSAAQPACLRRFVWLRCQHEGWWESSVQAGDNVSQGQAMGTVTSIDGTQTRQTITAPAGGVVMFLTTSPAVAADGLLLGLGCI